jgi:signal transduction histidine kinase
MSAEPPGSYSECVLVVAPTGRDADVTRQLFEHAGIQCIVENRGPAAAELIRQGIGALVMTDISLAAREPAEIFEALAQQPPWSDLAVLALCRDVRGAPAVGQVLERLSNATVLDRPTSRRALVSSVKAALRGRRWQYRIRDQIQALMKADDALREADRRKDEFLATLAHELRNPLAPLKTGIYLMSTPQTSGEQFVRVREMMDRQLSQLVKLIDDLLEISRIATGRIALQRERLDLRSVIAAAIEGCQPLLDAAGHQLTVALPDREVWVRGDGARLTQAVGNLVNNAVKYTPGGGTIRVSVEASGDEAVIAVEDNGVGIPRHMLDDVFQMFTQVNRTLDRSQGGLGIGLALVRNLIELHGGTVVADSGGDDRGSRFTVRLPATHVKRSEAAQLTGAGGTAERERALRILVVDDNVDAADSLGMLLEARGHEARVVYDGEAAVRTAADFRPEAIFCDIGMGGMDGIEVAMRLRQDTRFATTVLVAVTGWGTADDVRRTREAGFDFHLTKPASAENLHRILSRV